MNLDNECPVDPDAEAVQKWLAKLQGNILKFHGRNHAVHILLSFGEDRAAVTETMKTLARNYVTSALMQYLQAERFKKDGKPGELFGNLFMTAHGYEGLGFKPGKLFAEPEAEGQLPTSSTFAGGMQATAVEDFGDPPVASWEKGYQAPIDAMLLLAHDDEKALNEIRTQAENFIQTTCMIRAVEVGRILRNSAGAGIEHFGFADGRSQPLYFTKDFQFNALNERCADSNGEGIDQWDPLEPLGRVLVRDEGVDDPEALGSFLVFRKLEQDVHGFHSHVAALAASLGLTGRDADRVGAMAVGRFPDGTPLVLQKEGGWFPSEANNFNYRTDVRGARCPLHAHVRKVNRRGHNKRAPDERRRRITRRSIPYGIPGKVSQSGASSSGVGVLFMCYQASVRNQFSFIQKHWCNSRHFPQGQAGSDPLVGQNTNRWFDWPVTYNKDSATPAPLDRFIHMKGGEFFFAPSLPFFENLRTETAP